MTAHYAAFIARLGAVAAALLVGGCGAPTGAPAAPDLLARPDGFRVWDYERLGPRPGSLFGPGGTVSGRVKVIERWPLYFNELMVSRETYDRVQVGMSYDEVRDLTGDVLLPFRFEADCEYELCCVQEAHVVLFRFRGGTLVRKDQRGIE